jgi:hypothetical protein
VICRTLPFHMSFQNRIAASAWDIPLNMSNNLIIISHDDS